MISAEMHFYVSNNADGSVHVQNMAGGYSGQHHVHTKEDFELWAKDVPKKNIHVLLTECGCGMQPGEVKYDIV